MFTETNRKENMALNQKEIDAAGITRLELSKALGIGYSTLSSKILGYSTYSQEEEETIRAKIKEIAKN